MSNASSMNNRKNDVQPFSNMSDSESRASARSTKTALTLSRGDMPDEADLSTMVVNPDGLVSDLIGAALIGTQYLEQKLLSLSRNQASLGNLVERLEQSTSSEQFASSKSVDLQRTPQDTATGDSEYV